MSTPFAMVLICAVSSGINYAIAKRRGARASFWVVMGALFGPLSIPFVFFARPALSPRAAATPE
ncbi:MAG: hypothetical protein AAF662_13790 [Pseudomonadota bacterium]